VTVLPNTIAVYPLLTSVPKEDQQPRVIAFDTASDASNIYIIPPTDFTLSITLGSQMMSDALAAELSIRGFDLKQLPIVIPEQKSLSENETSTFAVSLGLLKHMREHMNLEAILIGNVFLVPNRYEPSNPLVKRTYLRLIDVETLDVLCLLSLTYGGYAQSAEDAVRNWPLLLTAREIRRCSER
jgi:hypothetical protein